MTSSKLQHHTEINRIYLPVTKIRYNPMCSIIFLFDCIKNVRDNFGFDFSGEQLLVKQYSPQHSTIVHQSRVGRRQSGLHDR